MTLAEKLRMLRRLEGHLRGLGREMTQTEVARAARDEIGSSISQSYLSLIENGARAHLSQSSRDRLSRFFRVHPGYLVDDPPGYHTELTSALGTVEDALDRWLIEGAARLGHDPELSAALERLSAHPDSRRCLVLLGEIVRSPALADRLADTLLVMKERA